MPRAITHYLFAMDALYKLNENTQNIINNNLDMFILGCDGANIFNYYNDFSFFNNKGISNLNSLINHKNVDLFFKNMIMYCSNEKLLSNLFDDVDTYKVSLSYMYGFLSHYALDKFCKPYIDSIQSKLKKQYKYKTYKSLHKSIETHIDQVILFKIKHLYTYEFKDYLNINITNNNLMLLCDMYIYLLSSVHNKSLTYNNIKKSYITFKKVENKINSSTNLLSKIYLNVKNKTCKNSFIDNKIYSNFKICKNDLLNESKSIWINPYNLKEYNYSFLDLYNQALDYYVYLVDCINLYISNKLDFKYVLSVINSYYI